MAMETDRDIDWTGIGAGRSSEVDTEAPEAGKARKVRKDKGKPRAPKLDASESFARPVERIPVDGWVSDVLYEALGTLLVVGGRLSGVEPDRALLLRFTGEEKDMLRPPTIAVLEKHAGKIGPYQEETALVIALLAVLIKKVEAVKAPAIDYGTIPPPTTERPQ